jgi:hypothetical protein
MVDMSSGQGKQDSNRTCYECGATGHIKSNCPVLKKKANGKNNSSNSNSGKSGKSGNSGKATQRYKIPGLTDKENDEVDTLIKDKISSLKPLADVSDGAKHEITYKNKVVAKFCKTCKRFLKGDKAHFTSEHKRKSDAGSNGSAASANVAIIETPIEEAPEAEPVLAPSLMRCEAIDYDTPTLPSNYDAFLGDTPDDASIDSVFNAFVAVPTVPTKDEEAESKLHIAGSVQKQGLLVGSSPLMELHTSGLPETQAGSPPKKLHIAGSVQKQGLLVGSSPLKELHLTGSLAKQAGSLAKPAGSPPTELHMTGSPPTVGPWYEIQHPDGSYTLFNSNGEDATGYNAAWFASKGLPSTAAELNRLAASSNTEASDESDFVLVAPKAKKKHPKGRSGRVL